MQICALFIDIEPFFFSDTERTRYQGWKVQKANEGKEKQGQEGQGCKEGN